MVKLKEIPLLYNLKLKISFFKTLFKDIKFLLDNKTSFTNIFNFLKSRLKIIRHKINVNHFFSNCNFSEVDWFMSKTPVFIHKFENNDEKNKVKNILEIGSFEGRSTIFFLNYFSNCNITCVDTWSGSHEQGDIQFDKTEKNFDINIAKYSKRVKKIKTDSDSFFKQNSNKYDFIFIDGYHHADQVLKDGLNSLNCIKPGGYILFDDYTYRFGGHQKGENPINAINKILKEKSNIKIIYLDAQILIKIF